MARENVGLIECAHCGAESQVRKNVKAKLYYCCPRCGLIQGTGASFSEFILTRARMTNTPPQAAEQSAEGEKEREAAATPQAEPKHAPKAIPKADRPKSVPDKERPADKPKGWGFL